MESRKPESDETARPDDFDPSENTDAEGDPGGPYGFGRPAHRTDPSGHYRFEPRSIRPLPANPRIRWR
jgi:hypothetical protein